MSAGKSAWTSGYRDTGSWYKGAVHVHTDNSDGHYSLERVVGLYGRKELHYDFVTITDHDIATDVSGAGIAAGMVVIPGVEESFSMSHIVAVNTRAACRLTADVFQRALLATTEEMKRVVDPGAREEIDRTLQALTRQFSDNYLKIAEGLLRELEHRVDPATSERLRAKFMDASGEADYQGIIDRITGGAGLAILAHPHWIRRDYWDAALLTRLQRYTGIEIFNGDNYSPLTHVATDVWDSLLSAGRQVWAFGGDDFHSPSEFARVYNVARAAEKSLPAIVSALSAGSFYVSTGLELATVTSHDDTIEVAIKDDCFTEGFEKTFRFIGKDGVVLQTQMGQNTSATYRAKGDELYVRAHIMLETGATAYTQPFFRKDAGRR